MRFAEAATRDRIRREERRRAAFGLDGFDARLAALELARRDAARLVSTRA